MNLSEELTIYLELIITETQLEKITEILTVHVKIIQGWINRLSMSRGIYSPPITLIT